LGFFQIGAHKLGLEEWLKPQEHLSSKCEALSSSPTKIKKKKRRRRRRKKGKFRYTFLYKY
jgi:hypothetical protein